jgi:hypothetical protein
MADTIRLYLDEDAQQSSLIRALRARQVDVQTAQEAGLVGVPDEVQLAHAAEEKRVILTFNRGDFVKLHSVSSFLSPSPYLCQLVKFVAKSL